jgi:hypothetical protein
MEPISTEAGPLKLSLCPDGSTIGRVHVDDAPRRPPSHTALDGTLAEDNYNGPSLVAYGGTLGASFGAEP